MTKREPIPSGQDPQKAGAARALEFTDPWSPDKITEQDYEGARKAFNELVDTIIVSNPDHADVADNDEFCWSTVRYATYFPEDKSTLLFTVNLIRGKGDDDLVDRTIEITTVIPNEPSRRISYETLEDTGSVFRTERGVESRKWGDIEEIRNELHNIELARQMGERETPVNATEVQQLGALLRQSTIDDSWREFKPSGFPEEE